MKNKNSMSTIIIIILSIITIGLAGYIAYDKLLNNDNNQTNNNQNENKEEVNVNNTFTSSEELIKEIKPVFEFVYRYFDTSTPYCGEFEYGDYIKGNKTPSNGFYGSKQFKTYQEMIDDLKVYMTEEVFNQKESIKKEYYLEQDGKLYCEDFGKGGNIYQPENTIIQINSSNDNNINITVVMKLSAGEPDIIYETYNVTFTKSNDNWIVTSYEKQA